MKVYYEFVIENSKVVDKLISNMNIYTINDFECEEIENKFYQYCDKDKHYPYQICIKIEDLAGFCNLKRYGKYKFYGKIVQIRLHRHVIIRLFSKYRNNLNQLQLEVF